ncbi:MAG: isoprenylcysteine carboxylmethyltransferase family protein [Acidobacteria bacterium]|nr:isoprenylcysteine carboxylmethyltransferase family protein [Acidobacteriota bacterium]MBI3655450.1 isoprenylcysteine carboxylmethyltransferase family protein [Acidobacteriota bacterium]
MALLLDSLWQRLLLPARFVFFTVIFLGASLHPLEALSDPLTGIVLSIILLWRAYEHVSIGMKTYRFLKDPGKHTMVLPALSLWIGCAWPIFDYYNLPPTLPRVFGLRILGVALLCLGILIRYISIRTLGRFFTAHLKVNEGRRLIQEGIYKNLQHPSYFGMIFSFVGLPLAFCSLYGLTYMIFIGIPSILFRINLEESFLMEEFGNEYVEYRKHTYKFIPFLY